MKLRDIKIFTWLSMALLLATTSCHDDLFNGSGDNSDEFTVTFNLALEGMNTATRATGNDDIVHIAGGSQIDMLVYAVYYDANIVNGVESDTPDWQAATQYVKEYENEADRPFYKDKIEPGYGQTIIDVSETLQKGGKHNLTLTLKKGQQYQVVFWAQNHKTKAFVTDDLKKVQMKYKIMDEGDNEMPLSINNDEQRDAFCRSISLDGNESVNKNVTVYLKRPLAQINVGTRGFDFETITRNADKKYLYSKIRINRAARYLNVVEDYVYTSTIDDDAQKKEGGDDAQKKEDKEAFYTVDYEYNKIPAYWNMPIPQYPSYTINDTTDFSTIFNHKEETGLKTVEAFKEFYGKEEFLKVHLYDTAEDNFKHNPDKKDEYTPEVKDGYFKGYYSYARMGTAGDEKSNKLSEVFKYLSMCYILTPADDDKSDVLTNVKMWVATDSLGSNEVEVANLAQVPVKRNSRTNIVGSLLTTPADVEIVVDQDFAGQKITDNVESGEIVEGFYYDAENNEFQISSANGLVFFQQLVNGDLCVRQYNKDYINAQPGVRLGGPYPYYKFESDTKNVYWLKSKSHKYNEFENEEKAKMILKGTGYNQFTRPTNKKEDSTIEVEGTGGTKYKLNVWLDPKTGWPLYNNFSFYGATVKLMADIDLSGIEWIPIGFDCCNWDSSIGANDNNGYSTGDNNTQLTQPNYRTLVKFNENKIDIQFRRAFCGTFDGNGHTIYNMTTKRFGANVLEYNYQINGNSAGPYDNMQWFGRGFFGLCGPGVTIKNLRLQNVDVQGNNGVAGLVAVVSSADFEAKIDNCIIDGGTISATPLYRGDYKQDKYKGRTYARGVYVGGIVGQFSAKGDEAGVTNCEVRNLTISGFRRMGGIIGSIADQGNASMGNQKIQLNIKVENNSVANTLLICDQYTPFDYLWNHDDTGMWKNGFGWGASGSTSPMSDIIVGGLLENRSGFNPFDGKGYHVSQTNNKNNNTEDLFYNKYIPAYNSALNVQYTVLSVRPNEGGPSKLRPNVHPNIKTVRESTVGNISLEHIPMFSSLFVDEVDLTNNYYGAAQLRTKINFDKATLWIGNSTVKNYTFDFPIVFPNAHNVNYATTADAALTGMYVETVYLSGENAPNGRSVITPTGLTGENACVMYVTARDRAQFINSRQKDPETGNDYTPSYTLPDITFVKDVVLRGSPYAWAGMIFAPNENMGEVVLDNVVIYDVYKTLALERTAPAGTPEGQIIQNYTKWPADHTIKLTANDCNFRGYTIPGEGWAEVSYTQTTFEQGSETRYSSEKSPVQHELHYDGKTAQMQEFKMYRADSKTTFTDCFFKAPYFIDLSHTEKEITFTDCYATSAYKNVMIDVDDVEKEFNKKVAFIEIAVDTERGKTVIRYYSVDVNSPEANRPGYLITTKESK